MQQQAKETRMSKQKKKEHINEKQFMLKAEPKPKPSLTFEMKDVGLPVTSEPPCAFYEEPGLLNPQPCPLFGLLQYGFRKLLKRR